ncbi:MAG: hypothetical protein QGH15_11140 [Kiritimatiellia bacterium]|jgi:radical SAM superfamily enzyme YgiQ (UPF0313 family)|nr:hypothetical protein [Kiritimatiellia bacterium]MDP6781673.1 hypothetical protein [Alphaproteobacteria bacterium]|tara:strand:- start:36 stop:2102 length:2067 start_codon:yes stop_codon:yes gene_type:complete
MPVKISFADLTHTGQTVQANVFPLGISMVAAYALQELGDEIETELFRYPDDFNSYLETNQPRIAAFSCYSWNINLACHFARRIKEKWPDTVTVFGSVNFPSGKEEQQAFLAARPEIDFFIENDGERPFVAFYEALRDVDFDAAKLKAARTLVPSARYIADGELVAGEMMERIMDMDTIPSVYLSGLSDKFFDGILAPMIETARGCPYACTFCVDGHRYSNKTRRFSQERIYEELDYIAPRTTVNEFVISDLNFGMFKQDVETSRYLAKLQDKYNFPRYLVQSSAKNNKANIIEISKIMGGTLAPAASIQTTDEEVLRLAKRKNLPVKDLAELAATKESDDATFLSEIIMNLPGESKRSHFKTVFDMLDAGSTLFRSYQFTLLEGTEAANPESRERFALQTKFRVLPRCFGSYVIMGETVDVVETEEICVGSGTMTYEDYRDCRTLDLTMEIFINDAIFHELLMFLDRYGVSRTEFVKGVHARAVNGDSLLAAFYGAFAKDEEENLWDSPDEVAAFVARPGVIEGYIDGKHGTNEIHKYRTKALIEHMDILHEIAFGVGRSLLGEAAEDEDVSLFLSELCDFSRMRKDQFLDPDKTYSQVFHFDFIKLVASNFILDPFSVMVPDGVHMEVVHTQDQSRLINRWISQYGSSGSGLARLLSRSQLSAMYRVARAGGQPRAASLEQGVATAV